MGFPKLFASIHFTFHLAAIKLENLKRFRLLTYEFTPITHQLLQISAEETKLKFKFTF